MKEPVRLTRRGLAGVIAAVVAAPATGQTKQADEAPRARREALLKVKIPRETQPACVFRA
jgi:hypothetical protein